MLHQRDSQQSLLSELHTMEVQSELVSIMFQAKVVIHMLELTMNLNQKMVFNINHSCSEKIKELLMMLQSQHQRTQESLQAKL